MNELWNLLQYWSKLVRQAGYEPPRREDLRRVAAAGSDPWPTDLDPASFEPWRQTIEFIRDQKRMGVADPVGQLPNHLLVPQPTVFTRPPAAQGSRSAQAPRPTPSAGPASTPRPAPEPARGAGPAAAPSPSPAPDDVMATLNGWREWAVRERIPGIGSLRPETLSKVARDHRNKVPREGIKQRLQPSDQRVFVDPMLDALVNAGLRAPDAGAVPPPAPPSTASAPSSAPSRQGQPAAPPQQQDSQPAPPPVSAPVVDPELAALRFAATDWSGDQRPFEKLTAVATADGSWHLSWDAVPAVADVVVYRVVLHDEEEPIAPEYAEALTITRDLELEFSRPFESAVRYLQVWSNTGRSLAEAARAQPVRVVATELVAPVQHVEIREEQGTVIGQWQSLPGTTEVQVFRMEPGRSAHGALDPRNRILAGDNLMGGFVDPDAERGKRYVYQVLTTARVGSIDRMSAAVSKLVTTTAPLDPVLDLDSSAPRETSGRIEFDLSWSAPPAGRVVIYRTADGPLPGAEQRPIALSALGQARLADADRLAHPVNAVGPGQSGMRNVPWPTEWMRAYFTPVTIVGDTAVVGATKSVTRNERITDAAITERVFSQVLTFSWPAGASSVLIYVGPSESETAAAVQGQSRELTRQQWEQFGGYIFQTPLPSEGCRLHLVPVSFNGGKRIDGEATMVDYSWMIRVNYQVEVKRHPLTRKRVAVLVGLTSDLDSGSPRFVLVHNPSRFPLDFSDGTTLQVTVDGDETSEPTTTFRAARLTPDPGGVRWRAPVNGLSGFIRVFVHEPPERFQHVALLDPPVADLTLGA